MLVILINLKRLVIVKKYFFNKFKHAAPEEDENVRVEEKVHVVRPQKTYKIIFIKAPSIGSSLSAANYPVYPQVCRCSCKALININCVIFLLIERREDHCLRLVQEE